jgi:hypothetical protein
MGVGGEHALFGSEALGKVIKHTLPGFYGRTMDETKLLDPRTLARGLFRPEAIKTMLDEHASGRVNHRYRLWTLLMLELWFRTYVDRPRSQLTGPAEGIL